MKILTYNAHLIPLFQWFGSDNLKGVENRKHKIRAALRNNNYDVTLIQEDFLGDIDGAHAGKFPPTGLTIHLPHIDKKERKRLFKGNWDWDKYKEFGWEDGDWLTRKGFMWADLHQHRFFNTHLDSGDNDVRIRKKQLAHLLKKFIKKDVMDPKPTIIAGDFNPESEIELAYLTKQFAYLGFERHFAPNRKMKDFIFTKDVEVLGVFEDRALSALSDHPAMYIETKNPWE